MEGSKGALKESAYAGKEECQCVFLENLLEMLKGK
jgi:hypothetical protein